MKSKQRIYHIVRGDFKGDTLYPLNVLKDKHPDLHEAHAKKYEHRKHITELFIPQLDCYWGDVVHMSAVHPQDLVKALAATGLAGKRYSYFEIDPATLDPKKTVIYVNKVKENMRGQLTKDDFRPFDAVRVRVWGYIPKETIAYWKKKITECKEPLLFLFVPHVLYKGNIDVSGLTLKKTSD